MTHLRRLLALTALVGAVAVLGACGGVGSQLESLTVDELTQAAAKSAEVPSGRFELAMDMTVPGLGLPFAFSGEGAFDTKAKQASVSFDFSSFALLTGGVLGGSGGEQQPPGPADDPSDWKLDAVQDGNVVYIRFPAIASELPAGKSWVRIDSTKPAQTRGLDLSGFKQFTDEAPGTLLEFLESVSGEIETVGSEELRGVPTTHYRATIDLAKSAALAPAGQGEELREMLDDLVEQSGVSKLPVDVWLDDEDRIRKLAMSFGAARQGTEGSFEGSLAFELYDYGADVEIEPPPAEQVVDASKLPG
jgi:hypothetical protein